MPNAKSRNGAAMLLDQFEVDGVDCIFASPIAVMAPIWEELASRGNTMRLRYFRCRHELLAVGAAHGYYQLTGAAASCVSPYQLRRAKRVDGAPFGDARTRSNGGRVNRLYDLG